MNELINRIEQKLKDLYPHIIIKILRSSNTNYFIYCNDKRVGNFNPELLQKELEFLSDRPDFLDLFIDALKEPIEKFSKKLKRTIGMGGASKGLSLQQIKEAVNNTKSNKEAARYLHISYPTWRKYASMYKYEDGISYFNKHLNRGGAGLPKGWAGANFGRLSVQDIIDGKASNKYATWRIKNRLIRHGYLEEKCSNCGFEERRASDYKVPLELDYIDGYKDNKSLENLRLLCYNCYFLLVGDLMGWRRNYKIKNDDKKE